MRDSVMVEFTLSATWPSTPMLRGSVPSAGSVVKLDSLDLPMHRRPSFQMSKRQLKPSEGHGHRISLARHAKAFKDTTA